MHVPLGSFWSQRVQLLLHVEHVERGHSQDLSLATLEQCRTVHPWQDANLGTQGADVANSTTVDADMLGEGAVPNQLLGQRAEGARDLFGPLGELVIKLGVNGVFELVSSGFALLLASDAHRLGQPLGGGGLYGFKNVSLIIQEDRELSHRLGQHRGQFGLCVAQCLDERLGRLDALSYNLFGRGSLTRANQIPGVLSGFGLNHHDRHVAIGEYPTSNGHFEGGQFALLNGRETDPLITDQRHPDAADRAGERQASQRGGCRTSVDRQHVVTHIRVQGHHRDDNLHLVAQPLHEAGTQRTVG